MRVLGKAGLTSAPLPLPLNQPTHILDIGTGPGDWAIRMAEVYSPCRVTGTDISAIAQRENVPVNVNFVVEDAESWERASSSYDLIHFRGMSGAFRDWIYIYDCAFESLKPGGWVEVQDVSGIAELFKTRFHPTSLSYKLFQDLQLAAAKSGRKQDDAHLEPSLFWDTGFQAVTVSEHTVPLEATLGELWLITILDGIEAMALRLLTAHMGWRTTECREACERAARELAMLVKDPSNAGELNISIKTVIGRKPFVE